MISKPPVASGCTDSYVSRFLPLKDWYLASSLACRLASLLVGSHAGEISLCPLSSTVWLQVGWKHQESVAILEGKRKEAAAEFYKAKKELTRKRAKAVAEASA